MITDAQLLIRTWHQDLDWLAVSLQSVRKYWKSAFPPVIIATPACEGLMPREVMELGCTVFYEPQWADHRRGQCWLVFHADLFVSDDAEAIIFTDSDCLFTRESNMLNFCDQQGRPQIVHQNYVTLLEEANAPDHNCYLGYRRWVTEVLGVYPSSEYMRAHPFLYYTDTITACRMHAEKRMGKAMQQIMEGWHSGFSSEFNLIGAYAFYFEKARYDFELAGHVGRPRVRQFHSYSQTALTERAEIAEILA